MIRLIEERTIDGVRCLFLDNKCLIPEDCIALFAGRPNLKRKGVMLYPPDASYGVSGSQCRAGKRPLTIHCRKKREGNTP